MTPEERKAIRALQRVAKAWPKTLTLVLGGTGTVRVMPTEDTEGDFDLRGVTGEDTGLRATAHS